MRFIIKKRIKYLERYIDSTTNLDIIESSYISYDKVKKLDKYGILTEDLVNSLNHILRCINHNEYCRQSLYTRKTAIYNSKSLWWNISHLIQQIEERYDIKLDVYTNEDIDSILLDTKSSIEEMYKMLTELNNNDTDILHEWCKAHLYTKEECKFLSI